MVNIIENTTENRRINTTRKNDNYIVNFTRERTNNKRYAINKSIKINKSKFSLSTRRDGDNSLDILKGGDANTVDILLIAVATIMGWMVTTLT